MMLSSLSLGLTARVGGLTPALDLSFLSGVLDPRITASGGTGAARVNSSGNIVAATTPRFDYDPITLAAKGVLIEEQRTNLVLQSAAFDNSSWTLQTATITANSSTGPDGAASMDKVVAANAATLGQVFQGVSSVASGATLTALVYAKAGEWASVDMRVTQSNNTTPYASVVYNVSTGATISAAAATNGGTGVSSTITAVGGNIYRITLTVTIPAGITNAGLRINCQDVGGGTSDGTKGLYLWGAQLEAGSFATSYIPTTTAAVTRTSDSLTMTGSNFSSWYSAPQGTFVVSFDAIAPAATGAFRRVLEVDDGTTNNYIALANKNDGSGKYTVTVTVGGVVQGSLDISALTANTRRKVAFSYGPAGLYLSDAGAATANVALASIPTVNQMVIGNQAGGAASHNGHVATTKFYPTQVIGSSLQVLAQ